MKKSAIGILVSTFLICTWLPQKSFGQVTQIVISGKVIDNVTQAFLSYATITIKGQPVGVVSNQLGEFTFKIASPYRKDTLIVSMIGYETHKRSIKDIESSDNLLVPLQMKTTMLHEVVITDKKLTAKDIIENAIRNIKLNYPQKPYLL